MSDNNTNPPTGNPSKGGLNSDQDSIPMGKTEGPAVTPTASPAPGASSTAPYQQKSADEKLQEAKADVKGEAHAAMSETQSRVGAVADEARNEASKLAEQARRRAELAADEYKGRAAEQGHSMAERLRAAGQEFGSGSLPDRYVGRMADSLSDAADAFSRKDLGSLIADSASFARRNPAAFVGGAMLLGFAAARFLKSSSREIEDDYEYRTARYQPDYAAPTAGATARPAAAGRPMPPSAVHAPEK